MAKLTRERAEALVFDKIREVLVAEFAERGAAEELIQREARFMGDDALLPDELDYWDAICRIEEEIGFDVLDGEGHLWKRRDAGDELIRGWRKEGTLQNVIDYIVTRVAGGWEAWTEKRGKLVLPDPVLDD